MSPEVQDLNLNRNELKRLDAFTFRGLNQLRYLYIEDNLILYIEAGTFEGMSSLEHLSLHGNKVQKFLDFVFSPLSSLIFIDLSYIHAPFNARAFANVTSLLSLNLDSNKFVSFPDLSTIPRLYFHSWKLSL